MSNALVEMMGAAGNLLDGKRSKIVRKVARRAVKGGGRTFRRALSMLRGIDLGDVLVWLRLSRRRGPLGTIALLGGGAVVGAGLVMLLSPRSGPEVRRTLRSRTAGFTNQARQALEGARSGVEHLEQQAAHAVRDVERRVEDTVSEALRTARESVRTKPD
jgi:gas vesicle protein